MIDIDMIKNKKKFIFIFIPPWVINYNITLIAPPPGVCLMLSLDPIFGFALSLKSSLTVSIFLSPPPGLCVLLSSEPTLGLAFHCNLTL